MPLKIVKRKGREAYYLRGTVRGQSIFESTETSDPERAEGLRIRRETALWDQAVNGTQAVTTFSQAAASYLSAEQRGKETRRLAAKLIIHFRSTALSKISQESLEGAYRACLTNGLRSSPANKVRAVITPLRAILEHAAIMGWCGRPAFKKPSVPKTRTDFAYPAQVDALILAAAPHAQPLLTFLAGTGVRPSEAFELKRKNVDLRGARAVVQQKQGDFRYVDLCPRVIAAIAPLMAGDQDGHVFQTPPVVTRQGRVVRRPSPYRTGDAVSGQVKTAFATAARLAGWPGRWREWVPKGGKKSTRQWVSDMSVYALRHSWASWSYCVSKDLMKVRDEGGWSSIATVTIYAKLMPEAYRGDILAWRAGGALPLSRRA